MLHNLRNIDKDSPACCPPPGLSISSSCRHLPAGRRVRTLAARRGAGRIPLSPCWKQSLLINSIIPMPQINTAPSFNNFTLYLTWALIIFSTAYAWFHFLNFFLKKQLTVIWIRMSHHMSIVLPANAALKFLEKEQKGFTYVSQPCCNQNW